MKQAVDGQQARSIRRWTRGALAMGAGLVVAAGALAADDPVVARLGASEIKASEVRHLLDGLDPAARKQATADNRALLNFVRAELGRRAVLEEAKRAKWDQRPEVQARIEQARNDVLVSSYLAASTTAQAAPVTDEQVRSLYDANLSRFMQPRRYHLAQIFLAVPDGATAAQKDAVKARAQDLAKKAHAANADFGELARTGSDDKTTGAHGGDLGWLPETELVPAVASAVQGLTESEVSPPIEAKDGWHILKELGTKAAGPAPLDEVKPAIVNTLRQQAQTRAAQLYLEKLLNEQKAAVNEIELDRLTEGSGG